MVNAGQLGSSEELPIRSVQHATDRDESRAPTTVKPVTIHLSFAQLWNISFAFFGIQVGWGLQMANASAIFEFLGASAEQLPLLWLAAPVSGLVIQPLVGYMSDRTYHPIGRRRPYFLCGALLSSLALIVMPNSPSLWIATGSLWLLDAAANITMTPFRSFVADLVPEHQHAAAFSIQGVAIGLGAVVASALPWAIAHLFPSPTTTFPIPFSVKLSFYIGAFAFTGAVLWTMFASSKPFFGPQPPSGKADDFFTEFKTVLSDMPVVMQRLAWVQCFSWLGMFCLFLYFPPAVAHNIFGASQGSELYTQGIEWAGLCMALYNLVCCCFSFALPAIARKLSAPIAHAFCLICGALSLASLTFVHTPSQVLFPMVGVGMAFASMLSLPYAMLT
ncbi:MAG: MFS transporter [Cyanobacteria bacterium P01_D01_bin.105]